MAENINRAATMPRASKRPLPGGGWQMSLKDPQPKFDFEHRERWRPKDVALMDSAMRRWYATQYCDVDIIARHPDTGLQNNRAGIEIMRAANRAAFSHPERMSVLMSPDAALIAEAAALSLPDFELRPQALPSPNGVLYFVEPQLLGDLAAMIVAADLAEGDGGSIDPGQIEPLGRIPVRAISWGVWGPRGSYLRYQVFADGPACRAMEDKRIRSAPAGTDTIRVPDGVFDLLTCFAYGDGVFQGFDNPEGRNRASFMGIIKYIRSAFAIAETRGANDKTVTVKVPRPKTKHGKRQPPRVVDVRTVSLARPEYAHYESDAATGRKVRAHWVRGHWREQWYASEEVHRTLWIEGHMRGDAGLGTVTGARVHTITAPKDAI